MNVERMPSASASNLDVKAICLDILRDLFSASRQLAMYPMGHPITNDTLRKPLEKLNSIFSFKRSFVLQVMNERLAAEGLLLENNVFVRGLLNDLLRHQVRVVEMFSDVGLGDLYHFLGRLSETNKPAGDYFQKYLDSKAVKTIKINSPLPTTLFAFEESAVASPGTRFMLDARMKNLAGARPEVLTAFYLGKIVSDEDVATRLGVDIRLTFLVRHLASVVSEISEDEALEIFRQVIYSSDWLGEADDKEKLTGLRKLWKEYVKRSEDISALIPVYDIFKSVGATEEVLEFVFDKGTLIKLRGVRDAEEVISSLKTNRARDIDFHLLRKTVFKLASSVPPAGGGPSPLDLLLRQLLDSMTSGNLDTRQRSLRLTIEAMTSLADGSFWQSFSNTVKEIVGLALKPGVGPELVELVSWTIEKAGEACLWEEMKICSQTLRMLAKDSSDARGKLARSRLEELADSPILNDILVDAVLSGKGGSGLYEAIASIASRRVAAVLVEKIDSPDKGIRARVIKSLVKMGHESGPEVIRKFGEIVGRGETDDETAWYRLRNLLRVLGQVKYLEALPYFEILAGWRQARIKLELTSACESMEAAATMPILARLAVDLDPEVRRAAIIVMGMSAQQDAVKSLRAVFDDPRADRAQVVAAIGRIGGTASRDLLIELYENSDIFKRLNISKKEEQTIKIEILQALSSIGDDVARSKIELYSKANKGGLFKRDLLSKTASVLLDDTIE